MKQGTASPMFAMLLQTHVSKILGMDAAFRVSELMMAPFTCLKPGQSVIGRPDSLRVKWMFMSDERARRRANLSGDINCCSPPHPAACLVQKSHRNSHHSHHTNSLFT